MKTLFTAALLFAGLSLAAQTSSSIQLRTGQKIRGTVVSQVEADLGMGMLMKNDSESKTVLSVNGEKDDNYLVSNTLEKVKMKVEFMGQEQRYDSENESDKDSELGKQMSPLVGQPFNLFLSRSSGKVIAETVEENTEKSSNPLQDVLGGNGLDEASVSTIFFLVPKNRKNGESWNVTDSSAAGVSKHTYTLNRIDGTKADISFTSVMDVAKPMESQGQEMIVTMNVKSKGTLTSDTETSIVSKRAMETEINGNIEVMGQNMPIMATANQVMTYEYE